MATPRKKSKRAQSAGGSGEPPSPKKQLLVRIHDRHKVMTEADESNRRNAKDDIEFVNVPGRQWDANMKKERGDRPCYEFNKLRINGKRVINEIRANRPQAKVNAVEGGDTEGAELRVGLYRNIASTSDLDSITDQQAEYQVDGGYGAFRVDTEYAADSVFDQDIVIRGIKNPFCLYSDPACKDILLRRDAEDWILTERITKKAFEAKYGDVEKIDFEGGEFDDSEEWADEETVRVCEYWYKEPYDKEIVLVAFPPNPDGSKRQPLVVDTTTDEWQALSQEPDIEQRILKRRTVKCQKIMMCVASGDAILEGPVERPGTMFPFVPVYGEIKVIDGKVVWRGLHTFSKDAQRSYNVSRTSIDETIAQAPLAKFWATPKQAEGHTTHWAEAHRKNYPFQLYNPDPAVGGDPPQRMGGAEVPVALLQQAEVAASDVRDTSGLHEASFGEESDEKSGIALARKQHQAGVVTFNFPDNMAKAHKRLGEIVLDYIPHVYDAERELRIIGADGEADYKRVNELVFDAKQGKTIRVNDLSAGRYDFTISTGPSFSTLRQEAAQVYGELGAKNPELMQVAGDLVFKSLDYPYADEIAKRWQAILPPQIQQQISEGKDIPPEAQAVMAQANQAMQMVQQQTQLVQQAAQEVEQSKADADKKKAEVQTALANLKTAEAQFEAKVAKAEAQFIQREAHLAAQTDDLQIQKQGIDHERQMTEAGSADLSSAQKAVQQIDQAAAQFMEAAGQIMEQIRSQAGVMIAMPKRSRIKGVRTVRENGALVAIPEYDGESDEPRIARVRSTRGPDGSLVGVPEYEDQTAAPARPN